MPTTLYPYTTTIVEVNADSVKVPRIGKSDATVSINADSVIVPRIGKSDAAVEVNSDLISGYVVRYGIVDSTVEVIIDSPSEIYDTSNITVDVNDNTTETIVVGNKNSEFSIFIDFTIVKLTSLNTMAGKIYITHNGVNTNSDIEYINDLSDFAGISFDSRINGNDIELDVIATSVGEDLKIIYYIRKTI